jgi:hypothetical protein
MFGQGHFSLMSSYEPCTCPHYTYALRVRGLEWHDNSLNLKILPDNLAFLHTAPVSSYITYYPILFLIITKYSLELFTDPFPHITTYLKLLFQRQRYGTAVCMPLRLTT